jgi:hypothetical protein
MPQESGFELLLGKLEWTSLLPFGARAPITSTGNLRQNLLADDKLTPSFNAGLCITKYSERNEVAVVEPNDGEFGVCDDQWKLSVSWVRHRA